MSDPLQRFQRLIRRLFQMDRADLDFGIYRIMNQRAEAIDAFLTHDLLPQISASFALLEPAAKTALQEQIDKMVANLEAAQVPLDSSDVLRGLQAQLAETHDVGIMTDAVLSHLYRFFSRYYHNGDFLSLQRSKDGLYAIPYQGEEVKLHWANRDQYYIKSAEMLINYRFKAGRLRVQFVLNSATEQQQNTPGDAKRKRRYLLAADPVSEQGNQLVVRFDYHFDPENREQSALNAVAAQRILDAVSGEFAAALAEGEPPLIEKHLGSYTARNTFDYFIHKDLGAFLNRELDFFIKNELLNLDELAHWDAKRAQGTLNQVRVIRSIGLKIITFLKQLEDFQRRLWLKKKFILTSHWCITLDRIPESFYAHIAANDAQRDAWVTLFAIDGVDGYSAPLSEDFLKSNPSLVLDTRHFDALWSEELLAGFTSLDDQLSGMLVHGDNANALRLLKARLKGQIDCVYIDPPYNTGSDHFVYKDNYRHSTWLTMMEERLEALFPLAGEAAALFVSIDDNEAGRLVQLIQNLNEDAVFVTLIAAQLNPRGRSLDRFVAKNHEYITCVALRGGDAVGQVQKSAKQVDEYKLEDTNGRYRLLELRNRQSSKFNRLTRPNLFYSLYVDPKSGAVSLSEDSASFVETLPRNTRGEDGCWTWGQPKVRDEGHLLVGKVAKDGTGRVFRKDYLVKEGQQTTTKSKTIWTGKELNNELGKELLKNMFDHHNFSHPKSPALIEKCIELGHTGDGWFADFFAGSGSSGHAILNRLRAGHAVPQYLLVEWGEYFDAILQPRILKAIYSDQWKDGVPTHGRGVSQLLRCIELESYEDALENLEFTDASAAQKALLDADDDAREEYTLRYLLGKESAGSASLLNLGRFADPFNYTLKRVHDGDTREQAVDLVATFNTLLGLRVNRLSSRFFVDAEFSEERGRMRISGHLQACPPGTGWCFRVVDGHTPEGERTLIIWRTLSDDPERDNLVLEAVVGSRCPSDGVDQIYVNGDNSLAGGLQRAEVHLIEPAFEALMFADAARP